MATEPAIKVWWCGKNETPTMEAMCEQVEGAWHHRSADEPSTWPAELVTGKDYGCGWRTLSKRRVTAKADDE